MERKRYFVTEDFKGVCEKFSREYFLRVADEVRMNVIPNITEFTLLKDGKTEFGGIHDPKLLKTLFNMEQDLIRFETEKDLPEGSRAGAYFAGPFDSEKYVPSPQRWYFFKLSDKIRELLGQSTLYMGSYGDSDAPLWGLENPAFYKGGELLCEVTSHESQMILFLTSEERQKFEAAGIKLRDPDVEYPDGIPLEFPASIQVRYGEDGCKIWCIKVGRIYDCHFRDTGIVLGISSLFSDAIEDLISKKKLPADYAESSDAGLDKIVVEEMVARYNFPESVTLQEIAKVKPAMRLSRKFADKFSKFLPDMFKK